MQILSELSNGLENKFDLMQHVELMSKLLEMMVDRIQSENTTQDVMMPVEQNQMESLQQTSLLRVQDYLDMLNKMK